LELHFCRISYWSAWRMQCNAK